MKNRILIIRNFVFAVLLTLCSCAKEKHISKPDYSQMANELIEQIIKSETTPCNCMEEIPETSLIKYRDEQTPLLAANDRNHITNELNLVSEKSLDSLELISESIVLDKNILNRNNLKLAPEMRYPHDGNSEQCPCGVAVITKPIFDKNFKTAVIYFDNQRSDCFPGNISTYELVSGKWHRKANSR